MSRAVPTPRAFSVRVLVLLAFLVLVGSLALAFPPQIAAVEVADANCPETATADPGGFTNLAADTWAQTFTALNGGALTTAQIDVSGLSGGTDWDPGDFVLEIRTIDALGIPTTTVLASQSVSGVPFVEYPAATTVTAIFSSPATVVASEEYALAVTKAGYYIVVAHDGDVCDGEPYYETAVGGVFLPLSTPGDEHDLVFAIFVTLAECSDDVDNDADGKIDFPADPGCESEADNSESPDPAPPPQCSDQLDNDADGKTDFPADPGCSSLTDNSESPDPAPPPQCSDQLDNDADGKTDFPADPGCSSLTDDSESPDPAPPPQCSDQLDNDADGKTDFPADPGCSSLTDDSESPDPAPAPQCSDQLDNDADGKTDFPADPGCSSLTDDSESPDPAPPPQCSDQLDNDADGKTDFPADPGCSSLTDNSESPDPTPTPSQQVLADTTVAPPRSSEAWIGSAMAVLLLTGVAFSAVRLTRRGKVGSLR